MILPEISKELENRSAGELSKLMNKHHKLRNFFESCDSPLEQKFLLRLLDYFPGYPCDWHGMHILSPDWSAPHELGYDVRIHPQRTLPIDLRQLLLGDGIKNYRADFLFKLTRWNHPIGQVETLAELVVEVDGHNFHERTKAQAKRDRSRDRLMSAAGYTVFRFTGSEIFHEMENKIDEVMSYLIRKINDHTETNNLCFY